MSEAGKITVEKIKGYCKFCDKPIKESVTFHLCEQRKTIELALIKYKEEKA